MVQPKYTPFFATPEHLAGQEGLMVDALSPTVLSKDCVSDWGLDPRVQDCFLQAVAHVRSEKDSWYRTLKIDRKSLVTARQELKAKRADQNSKIRKIAQLEVMRVDLMSAYMQGSGAGAKRLSNSEESFYQGRIEERAKSIKDLQKDFEDYVVSSIEKKKQDDGALWYWAQDFEEDKLAHLITTSVTGHDLLQMHGGMSPQLQQHKEWSIATYLAPIVSSAIVGGGVAITAGLLISPLGLAALASVAFVVAIFAVGFGIYKLIENREQEAKDKIERTNQSLCDATQKSFEETLSIAEAMVLQDNEAALTRMLDPVVSMEESAEREPVIFAPVSASSVSEVPGIDVKNELVRSFAGVFSKKQLGQANQKAKRMIQQADPQERKELDTLRRKRKHTAQARIASPSAAPEQAFAAPAADKKKGHRPLFGKRWKLLKSGQAGAAFSRGHTVKEAREMQKQSKQPKGKKTATF